ncbi:MAG: hypothetical protein NUV81_00785 [bacterium]|nr:hypothetical protein [bacterium]
MIRVRNTPPPPPADELDVVAKSESGVAPQRKVTSRVTSANIQSATVPSTSPNKEDDSLSVDIHLPPERLHFFLSDRYRTSLDTIREEFKLSSEDSNFISDLDRLVMSGQMDLDAYIVALDDELHLDPSVLKKLQAQLLADRFLPFGDDLKPSASDVAKEHELEIPRTSYYRVYSRPLTFSGVTSEVAEMAGIGLLGRDVRARLRDLIIAKSKNEQVDSRILEVMTRGESFGGLGFDRKKASSVLFSINDILERTTVLSEEAYGDWLAKKTSGSMVQKKKVGASTDAENDSKQEDRQKIEGELIEKKRQVDTTIGRAVESALAKISYKPTSPYLGRRLQNAISSRLRDVRNAHDFRDVLLRPEKVGGIGVNAELADTVAREMEAVYLEFHDSIATEEVKRMDEQVKIQHQKVEDRKKKRSEEHAKWFEEKMRGGNAVSQTTIPKTGKPSVDTVQHDRPRLVGLLDELSTVTRNEFRRMGDSPDLAIAQILKKIETVGQDSADGRIRAVVAFRASPLQKEYVDLVGRSFKQGKPIAEVAKERRAKGEDTLTPEEISAIIQLNSALHY